MLYHWIKAWLVADHTTCHRHNQWQLSAMTLIAKSLQWCHMSVVAYWARSADSMTWRRNVEQLNTLRPRQNGRPFPDDIFKWIFLNENVRISINISLKFVPRGPINNIPALVQKMAWRRPGDKPLSELMLASLLTHIWVTRPQWVNVTMSMSMSMSQELWGISLLSA